MQEDRRGLNVTQYGRKPDAALVAELRKMLEAPKRWASSGPIRWVDAGGRPRGYKFREGLLIDDVQVSGLYVEGYWKVALRPAVPDKLSLSVFYRGFRILGIDENGPSRHVNTCGISRPYYGKRVEHPQMHSVSDDQIYGYAEPLLRLSLADYWLHFLTASNIGNAPSFTLPPAQLGLLP